MSREEGVLKMIQGVLKSRAMAIQPRDLIQKDDAFFLTTKLLQMVSKLLEGFWPALWDILLGLGSPFQFVVEVGQLLFQLSLLKPCQLEANLLFEMFSDEEGLADPAPHASAAPRSAGRFR